MSKEERVRSRKYCQLTVKKMVKWKKNLKNLLGREKDLKNELGNVGDGSLKSLLGAPILEVDWKAFGMQIKKVRQCAKSLRGKARKRSS